MASELTIRLSRSYPRVVIKVAGEVDLATAPRLAHALSRASHMGNELLVDLEGVEFMDCAGLRVLFQWAADGGGRGPSVLWVTPGSRQVQRLFELTGASRFLTVIAPDAFDVQYAA